MEQADLVLVIGTSMQVSPVNRLPFLTKGKLILINLEKTGKESFFDIHIEGGAEASLTAIQERLEEKKGC